MKKYVQSLFDSYTIECAMKRIWDEAELPYFNEHMLLLDAVELIAESLGRRDLVHYAPDIILAVLEDTARGTSEQTSTILEELMASPTLQPIHA